MSSFVSFCNRNFEVVLSCSYMSNFSMQSLQYIKEIWLKESRQLLRSKLMDVLGGVVSRKAMEWASLIDHLNWRNKIAANPTPSSYNSQKK